MLKKTCAIGGLVIATAAGALLTSSPASAQAPTWGGGGWGRSYHSMRFFSHHRNFNANENELFNRIRIRIRNRNNNVAINNQAQRQREQQRQFQIDPEDENGRRVGAPALGAPA